MREIKLRTWAYNKHFYNFYLFHGKPYIWNYEETSLEPFYSEEQEKIYGKPIVEQYSEMKDKNGEELYEGDLVKSKKLDLVGIIIFTQGAFGIQWGEGFNEIEMFCDFCYDSEDIEFVGDVHNDSHLLKQ